MEQHVDEGTLKAVLMTLGLGHNITDVEAASGASSSWKLWFGRLLGYVVSLLRSEEARRWAKQKFGELIDQVLAEPGEGGAV